MSTATTPIPALYSAASAKVMIALYTIAVAGTWQESIPSGANTAYLIGTGGNALNTVQKGIGTGQYQTGVTKTILHGNNVNTSEPAIQWLYDSVHKSLYKVIRVVDDNKIQVECVHTPGTGTGITLEACGTRGFSPKVTIHCNSTGVAITVYKYNAGAAASASGVTYTAGDASEDIDISQDVDYCGPMIMDGSLPFSVAVPVPVMTL